MSLSLSERFKKAWNVFKAKEEDQLTPPFTYLGNSSYRRIDRTRLAPYNERTLINAIYTRLATDVAAIDLSHARLNANKQFTETIKDSLNECLTVEANIDQTGRELIFDIAMSMFDEGVVAVVPVDTSTSLIDGNVYDILSLRTGKITQWHPQFIEAEVYDDRSGDKKIILLSKNKVAIIENPFYSVMNEPNSTLKRLIRKFNLIDTVDDVNNGSNFNLIFQLPYAIKTEARRLEAEKRIQEVEDQLVKSAYGIAYVDNMEKITQLNRSIDTNLLSEIEYLTKLLYSQLGLTENILNGTASEQELLNYYNNTIEPIISAIANEMTRKFLTKTARTQGQSIYFVRNPFRLVPASSMAELADKFTRNEVLSSNEIRSIIGFKPVDDERADQLRNSNLNIGADQLANIVTVDNNKLDSEKKDNKTESDIDEKNKGGIENNV